MGNTRRCGKLAVLANPAARIPVWMACPVHRFTPLQLDRRYAELVALEFSEAELLRLSWIVENAMLEG